MRKFKRFPPQSLRFRSLMTLAGALLLLAAVAPSANAALITYFNFEGPTGPTFPVNLASQVPPGAVNTLIVTNYNPDNAQAVVPGLPLNVAVGDPDLNLVAMGLRRTAGNDPATFNIPLFSAQGFFQTMTVTFATNRNGNGFAQVQLFYSINGGGAFIPGPSVALTTGGRSTRNFARPCWG